MANEREDNTHGGGSSGLHVDPGDRLTQEPAPRGVGRGHLAVAVVLVAAIIGILFFTGDEEPPPPPEPVAVTPTAPEPEPEPELPPAPDIPEPEPEPEPDPEPLPEPDPEPEPEPEPEEPPLKLEDSDGPVRDEMSLAGGSSLVQQAMESSDLLQRGAGVIDGLSRGVILYKVLPVAGPSEKFATVQLDGQEVIDPGSFARYDDHARAVAELDTEQLASTFHTFRPLMEQAYAALGYDSEDFDNALIRALDRVIATPEIQGPIPVKRKEAVYLFVDPELESLAPVQKQLIRMGPENVALIRGQAIDLRKALLNP